MIRNSIVIGSILLLLTGCGDTSGDTSNRGDTKVTTITTEGDVTVKDTVVTDEGVYVDCGIGGCGDVIIGDSNTIYQGDEEQSTTPPTTPSVEFDLDNYDESYSQEECNDMGFFYCTIENKCLPKPADVGTCNH